jgi:hypothetical protein
MLYFNESNLYSFQNGRRTASFIQNGRNCQGTVVWNGLNNFTDVGDEISINKPGNYKANCRSTCSGTIYYSDLSEINIALLPLRIEANKYDVYPGEAFTLTAIGCTNGYIQWKINDVLQNSSDNPFTFASAGVYSANCTNWDATVVSGWVSLFINAKPANIPTITANKTSVYNSEDVVLSATGCAGASISWYIPARQLNGTIVYEWRSGSPQTVKGSGVYEAWCFYNVSNQGPHANIKIYELQLGDITISSNKTVAAVGEAVTLNIAGNCPSSAGVQWQVAGLSYWTNRDEALTVYGFGTYQARCFINDYSYGPLGKYCHHSTKTWGYYHH